MRYLKDGELPSAAVVRINTSATLLTSNWAGVASNSGPNRRLDVCVTTGAVSTVWSAQTSGRTKSVLFKSAWR